MYQGVLLYAGRLLVSANIVMCDVPICQPLKYSRVLTGGGKGDINGLVEQEVDPRRQSGE